MPIIVAILAVVIVGLGAALYFIPTDSASTPTPTPVNETVVQEANRTEEMQAAEEMTIKNDPRPYSASRHPSYCLYRKHELPHTSSN